MTDSQPGPNLPTTVNTPTDPPASGAGTTAVAAAPTTTPSAPPQNSNADRREHPTNKAEWLNSFYMTARGPGATNDRDPGQMTINDFSKIKTLSGEHAYWEDCHINWALELIHRKYAELEGVVITPTFWCSELYAAGMNPNYIEPVDSSDYRSNWAHMADTLRNGTIVVLPVNDGFQGPEETLKAYNKANETIEKAKETAKTANEEAEKAKDDAKKASEDAERAEKEAEEADKGDDRGEGAVKEAKDAAKKANEAAQEKKCTAKNKKQAAREAGKALEKANDGSLSGYLGGGGHWSYIVVDRRDAENPRAHYVDSLVVPKQRTDGRWAITNIDYNGRAAGVVLRGFDRLLGLRESGFEAHTLKFIPHQFHNNACKRDTGPCGPHIYAFLDHILGSKTTLIDPGMHTTFDVAASRARRAREFNFDSRTARSRFADDLFAERKSYEERRPDLAVSNLTSGVLNSVLTADDVIYLATGSKPSTSRSHTGDSGNDHGKGRQAKRDQNKKTDQSDPNTPDIYLGKHRYRNVPRDDTRIFPSVEADDKYTKPRNETTIPDFETVVPPTLKRWFNANFEKQDRPDYRSENWEVACRARLHVMIKKSLLGQSDNNLEELWSKDTAVFDPTNAEYANLRKEFEKKEDKRPMYGVMREMLMRHYMTKETVDELLKTLEKFKVKESAAGDKRKRDDDDDKSSDDDSDEDGPDKGGNKSKHAKHSQGGADGGSSGGGEPGAKAGGNSGSAGKHTKPQDFQTIAKEPINFLSMGTKNLGPWMLKVMDESPGLLTPNLDENELEIRLRLHRAYNVEFTPENLDKTTAGILRKILDMRGNLGHDHVLERLNLRTDDVPPLPKQRKYYPDYYLLERKITLAKDNDENGATAGIDYDPKHGDGPLIGNSSGGNNGPTGLPSVNTSNTTSSKRKHDGNSDSAAKKPKLSFKPLKTAVGKNNESAKEDDAKTDELENDNADISVPKDVDEEEDASNDEPANDDAEHTIGGFEEEEDAPGWNGTFVSSSSELSSLSEHFDD